MAGSVKNHKAVVITTTVATRRANLRNQTACRGWFGEMLVTDADDDTDSLTTAPDLRTKTGLYPPLGMDMTTGSAWPGP
jgi:hypothetical protein